jgi:hypothetical protein
MGLAEVYRPDRPDTAVQRQQARELADLRAQLVRAEASGPAALTVLAGEAEEP